MVTKMAAAGSKQVITCARCRFSFKVRPVIERDRFNATRRVKYEIAGESYGHEIENMYVRSNVEPEVMITLCNNEFSQIRGKK